MSDCSSIDPFVTRYVDGELADSDRQAVADHISVCALCRSRVAAEQAVREAVRAGKPEIRRTCAPATLHKKCAALADTALHAATSPASLSNPRPTADVHVFRPPSSRPGAVPEVQPRRRRERLAPFALAASLVLVVSGAFVYRMTETSAQVLAAELTADHVKCFAMNRVLHTHETAAAVESSLASSFGWVVHLPDSTRADLELVGARPCLYGEGRVAHLMYQHNGEPVSLFMLPQKMRAEELVEVLGHKAAIWSIGDRTFVLVARGTRSEVERMAAVVHASIH